jgi:replicative DNA helicase
METLDRIIPRDTDAEESLLAGCLVDPSQIDSLTVSDWHFFDKDFGAFWNMLQDMRFCGDPVDDIIAVAARAKARGIWEQIGGAEWLGKVFQSGSTHKWHCQFYAKQIVTMANHRRLIEIGTDLARSGFDAKVDPVELAAKAQAALSSRLDQKDDVHRLDDLGVQMLATAADANQDHRRVFSGFKSYDATFGPFMSGDLVVVAARTSIGKTAFMAQVAAYHAHRGHAVLFCSLEMPAEQLRDRIFCAAAGINSVDYRSGNASADDRRKLALVVEDFQGKPFFIWCPRGDKSARRIAAKARSVKAEHGLHLLITDYIQKIHSEEKHSSREEQVASAARACKDIAIDLDVPNLVGCQLNAEADKSDEPALNQLRESAVTGHEADIVLLLHRKTRTDTDGKLIVAKHRNATTGTLNIKFDPVHQYFYGNEDYADGRRDCDRNMF